jgi:hypothetical protein
VDVLVRCVEIVDELGEDLRRRLLLPVPELDRHRPALAGAARQIGF